jgi:hypothetical protein
MGAAGVEQDTWEASLATQPVPTTHPPSEGLLQESVHSVAEHSDASRSIVSLASLPSA